MRSHPAFLSLGRLFALLLAFLLVNNINNIGSAQEPQAEAETIDQIKATFQQPGRDYSSGPLWTWNDLLTEEQIRSTLQDMAAQHVKQVWVHPRPGLMTPYLGDDWFRMWEISLDEAEKLDMNVWIYDENSYPSGFAGGFVPEAMPDSRGKGLHIQRAKNLDSVSEEIWYVYKIAKAEDGAESFENVTAWAKEQGNLPEGEWLVGRIQLAGSGGWFGGWWYVDLLKKGVTEKFIEITMEPYRQRFEEHFGKRLPGWFTDEPHLQTAGGLTWNEEIPVVFEQKFGYSLIDNIPSLTQEVGDWKKVRHNYQQVLLDLFIDRWAKPCFEYCEKHNLEFTGHYWEHGWPGASHGPDNMAMYAWHQRPAIDILMNQYNEGVNAQFGNARSVKELSSVANQMGYKRTLSETYGAGGWELRFEDMKRIADWQYALGVNTTNEHLSYVTIRGARKRDHPQSFSYHASWWDAYHVMADYHTRLSYALTRGEQINHVLVIEPTTTAWMYQGSPHLGKIGNDFQNMVNQLEAWQCEYDLGSEDIIARHGKIENGKFVVNKRAYDLVILPPNMENINGKVFELLREFSQQTRTKWNVKLFEPDGSESFSINNNTILCLDIPQRIDGKLSEEPQKLLSPRAFSQSRESRTLSYMGAVASRLAIIGNIKFLDEDHSPPENGWKKIQLTTREKFFHHRRILEDGELLFLCNTDIQNNAVGAISCQRDVWYVEQWDLLSGEVRAYPSRSTTSTFPGYGASNGTSSVGRTIREISVQYDIPPCGSLLLFLSNKPVEGQAQPSLVKKAYQPLGEAKVKRLEPNVLTLDYVDVNIGGELRENVYTYEANRWIWQKHGFPKNPWDNEVQFKDQLITKTFPNDSGFSATYKFTLSDQVPHPLYIVIERPDLYAITCNGKPVSAKEGDWWLDKSFGKVDLSTAAKIGANEVTVTARPMTMWHELEAAYLIGDFSLESAEKGFNVRAPKALTMLPRDDIDDIHTGDLERVSWLTSGIGFAPNSDLKDDREPHIVFDLGGEKLVTSMKIWNYNENNLTKRGVRQLKVYASKTPTLPPKEEGERPRGGRGGQQAERTHVLIGEYNLREGSGDGPQTFVFDARVVDRLCKFLVFEIVSNHNNVTYPIAEPKEGEEPQKFDDNAFVGLAEVKVFHQYQTGGIHEVKPLVVSKVSSELINRTHERSAKHIVDGSGLIRSERGWNQQGMPFYADGVAYTQTFDLGNVEMVTRTYTVSNPHTEQLNTVSMTRPRSRYVVSLGKWYGSVAKVIVNGNEARYIGFAPWECDISKHVKQGRNEISVIVTGTPKNLLGPHHGGAVRGTAWPGMFMNGPKDGPPAGRNYDVIGYGMFEPFVVLEK